MPIYKVITSPDHFVEMQMTPNGAVAITTQNEFTKTTVEVPESEFHFLFDSFLRINKEIDELKRIKSGLR
jgi:hypothetical protein